MIREKNIFKSIGLFILYYLQSIFVIIPIIILKINIDLTNLSEKQNLILNLISSFIFSILLIFIYRDYLKKKWKDFRKNFNKYLTLSLKYWGIGLLLMYILNILIAFFTPSKEAINEVAVQNLIKNEPFLALIFTTIFAPFVEEMVFRKNVQDSVNNKYLFIIISGLLFGGAHVINSTNIYDVLHILPYGALGAIFAYLVYKTDNIFSSIMVHFIHNGILTLLSIITII